MILADARMLLTLLRTPKLRGELARILANPSPPAPPLDRLSFVAADGSIDTAALAASLGEIEELRGPFAFRHLPVVTDITAPLAEEIVAEVFARLGSPASITEPQLNAALAMFVADVAGTRRSGVDSGFLLRESDGSRYRLRALSE